jgi:PAS domain S-box-containing protein
MKIAISDIFKELDRYNKDKDFIQFRQQNLKPILIILTIAGVIFVMGWQILDYILGRPNLSNLFLLRSVTCVIYAVTLFAALVFSKKINIKIPIYIGFYDGALFSALLALLTGGIASPYWVELDFLVIVWLVLVPFRYRELISNAFIFILLYNVILFLLEPENIDLLKLFEFNFILAGSFIIGALIAIYNNKFSLQVFLNENKIRINEERFRLFNENIHDVLWVVDAQTLAYTYISPSIFQLRGYTPEELIGKPLENSLTPESAAKARALLTKAIEDFYAGQRASILIGEAEVYCKNGGTVWIEIGISFLTNEEGRISEILGDSRNITQRKKMEEALMQSEERNRLLLDSLQEGLYVIQEGKFTFLNDAIVKIVGYSVDELLGKEFLTVIAPESREEVMNNYKLRMSGEAAASNYEALLLNKDGVSRVPVILSVTLSEFNGRIAIIGTAKDITDLKKTEEKLLKIQDQLRDESRQLQRENLRSQYETLKNQVNPHFLFNSLNVLTSLIKLDPDLAEKFTEQMAKVYRYVLEHREEDLVSLKTEYDFINSYVFLLEIRFKDKIKVFINIPDDKMECRVPPLALQLLIENAVKHNTFSKKQPLLIRLDVDDDNYLNVVNNLSKRELKIESTGLGLVNISVRFGHLTEKPTFFGPVNNEFVARIPLL